MGQSQHTGLQASIGFRGARARLLGGVSGRPENNVLSVLPAIAYRLILHGLEPNGPCRVNSFASRDLQTLRTLGPLFVLSASTFTWVGIESILAAGR